MNGFNAGTGDKWRDLEWRLLVDPESVGLMRFGPEQDDVNSIIRLAHPDSHTYEYMHQHVNGGDPVLCGMRVSDVSGQLMIRKNTGEIFLKVNLKWWNERRTQRPWDFKFRLTSSSSLTLAEIDVPGFVIDCQCTVPPNDLWETTVPLNRSGLQYFRTVEFGRLLPPLKMFGDHGPICA